MTAAKVVVSLALLVLLFSRVDMAHIWTSVRHASLPWLLAALCLYTLNIAASTWRWHTLLKAQDVPIRRRRLFGSFLVANFFNNFLPSNIGGDVIRIRDTAPAAQSTALAATVVLVDRGLGLMGLVLISAMGATVAVSLHGQGVLPVWPSWLWAGFFAGAAVAVPAMYSPESLGKVLRPLTFLHPEWVGEQIRTLTDTLMVFRQKPLSVVQCFGGAVLVQEAIYDVIAAPPFEVGGRNDSVAAPLPAWMPFSTGAAGTVTGVVKDMSVFGQIGFCGACNSLTLLIFTV